jgi:hypothetical protein
LLFALALCARYNLRDRKTLLTKSGVYDVENMSLKNKDLTVDELKNFDLYLYKLQQTALRMVAKVFFIFIFVVFFN